MRGQRWSGLLLVLGMALIAGAALALRLTQYGDVRLSVGMPDTPSYISSSRVGLFSWEFLTGRRLWTTNLLYKAMISSRGECGEPATVSNPAVGKERKRALQPCFEDIAVLQTALSSAAWLLLAAAVRGT